MSVHRITRLIATLACSILVVSTIHTDATAETALSELSTAEDEHGFVQTRTCMPSGQFQCDPGQDPLPVQWNHQTVTYQIHDQGSEAFHPGEDLTDELKFAVIESFDAWNEPECSDFELLYDGKSASDFVGWDQSIPREDNINVVVWRDEQWPHPQYNAIALTTVTFNTGTGEILSADVEFNSEDHQFTNSDENVQVDIRNTLTHEVGHFIGLDHSPRSDATMFATAPPGEISKRDLHHADRAGLCHIYSDDWAEDAPEFVDENGDGSSGSGDDSGSCSTTSSVPSPLWLLSAILLLAAARWRRMPTPA